MTGASRRVPRRSPGREEKQAREQEVTQIHPGKGASRSPRPGFACPRRQRLRIVASEDLHAMLERGLKAIVALTGARGGVIRLVPPAGGGMRLVCAVGLPPDIVASETGGQRLRHVRRRAAHRRRPGPGRSHHLRRRMGVFATGPDTGRCWPCPCIAAGAPSRLTCSSATRAPALRHHGAPRAGFRDARPGARQRPAGAGALQSSLSAERQISQARSTIPSPRGSPSCAMRMSLLQDAIRAGNAAHSLKYFRDIQESWARRTRGSPAHQPTFACPSTAGARARAREHRAQPRDRTGVDLRIRERARD